MQKKKSNTDNKITYQINTKKRSGVGKSVYAFESKSKVADAYRKLTKEVISHGERRLEAEHTRSV